MLEVIPTKGEKVLAFQNPGVYLSMKVHSQHAIILYRLQQMETKCYSAKILLHKRLVSSLL